jgi:hypothetical protein
MSEVEAEKAPEPPQRDLDVRLLELLVCPLSKGSLTYDPKRRELLSRGGRLAYPVRDGIPVMLPSEARQLDPEE